MLYRNYFASSFMNLFYYLHIKTTAVSFSFANFSFVLVLYIPFDLKLNGESHIPSTILPILCWFIKLEHKIEYKMLYRYLFTQGNKIGRHMYKIH